MLGDITTQGGAELSELKKSVKTYVNALYTNTLIAFDIPAGYLDNQLPIHEYMTELIFDNFQSIEKAQ